MKVCRVAMLLIFVASVSALADKPIKEEKAIKIQDQLSKTPPPELPAKAAKAVANEKGSGQEEMAGTIITAIAMNRASSLPPVVASIAAAAPKAAARAAAEAAKASPGQAATFAVIASKAAPSYASQIKDAVIAKVPSVEAELESRLPKSSKSALSVSAGAHEFKGSPPPKSPPSNRPVDPPGNGNGNRPEIPPGHDRDPKPGRDDNPRSYGRPY